MRNIDIVYQCRYKACQWEGQQRLVEFIIKERLPVSYVWFQKAGW